MFWEGGGDFIPERLGDIDDRVLLIWFSDLYMIHVFLVSVLEEKLIIVNIRCYNHLLYVRFT